MTSAAEAAIAAADAHVQVLGPLLRAASERPAEAEKAARAKVLQKRKVRPCDNTNSSAMHYRRLIILVLRWTLQILRCLDKEDDCIEARANMVKFGGVNFRTLAMQLHHRRTLQASLRARCSNSLRRECPQPLAFQ